MPAQKDEPERAALLGNMRRQTIEKQANAQVFRPDAQEPEDMMELIVRTKGNPEAMAAAVRNEIQSLDRSAPKFEESTVERKLGDQAEQRNFNTSLTTANCAFVELPRTFARFGRLRPPDSLPRAAKPRSILILRSFDFMPARLARKPSEGLVIMHVGIAGRSTRKTRGPSAAPLLVLH